MKKNIGKIFSLILAIILIFSVGACGNSSNNAATSTAGAATTAGTVAADADAGADADTADEATTEAATTTAAAATTAAEAASDNATVDGDTGTGAAAAADGPLAPFPETVTITWGVASTATQPFFDGDTYENNRWTRKLLEDLNINLEVAFSADAAAGASSSSPYDERMRTLLVSGDLPDIMHSYSRLFLTEAQKAGYLREIGSLLDQYATDPVKAYRELYPDSFEGGKIDGVQYGFPSMNDNFHTANYLWIRDDWLQNTNSEAPKTVDDFITLARAFTFDDPNKDGTKTYGFAMTNTVSDNMIALMGAYGVPTGWGGIYYRGNDGKITYSYIQPEVKTVLGILRDMYNDGVIDPEFITKEMSTLEGDILRNTVGMFDYRNWGTWYPYNLLYESEGIITRPYPIPTVPGVDFKLGVSNNAGGILFMLNSKCAYPEAYVKIINLFNQVCFESTDPNDFETYFTNDQAALVPVRPIVPNELYAPQIHEAIANGSGDSLPAAMKPFYDYVLNFENGTDTGGPAYGTWGQMFSRGSMAIALYDYRGANALVEDIMGAQIPQAYLDNDEILRTTIMNTTFTEIITGSKNLDSFDTFVQDWLSNGGQQILNEMEELYPQ